MDEFDPRKKEGGIRIAIEPFLHSVAPGVYAQTGVENGRRLPSTASEVTHLLLTASVMGATLYWRIYFTDLGQQLRDEVAEEYRSTLPHQLDRLSPRRVRS